MPKIEAATVAEHRALVQQRLIDAAEAILRSGDEPLTAAAVSSGAGIARNSIYRYVDNVDDLRALVLARHLPAWTSAVAAAVAEVEDPGEQVIAWVRANLAQAANSGHGWLMRAGGADDAVVALAHTDLRDSLARAWSRLIADDERAVVAARLTGGVLSAAFAALDTGAPSGLVVEITCSGAAGLVAAWRDPENRTR